MKYSTVATLSTKQLQILHEISLNLIQRRFSIHLLTQHRMKAADCIVNFSKHIHRVAAVTPTVKLSEFYFSCSLTEPHTFHIDTFHTYTAKKREENRWIHFELWQ